MGNHHVVLIGAGQLGSRHLQALALSELEINVSVVDPSEEALRVARQRYEQITATPNVKGVTYYNNLSEVAQHIDVCIIATSANHRLSVLEQLVSKHSVEYLVLEKVLFQSVQELDCASELLERYRIKAWVNCPRRMFPAYRELREILQQHKQLIMAVKGNDWGLACNAIHFIDLWAAIGEHCDYQIELDGLSETVLDSKRVGYKEIQGMIVGHSDGVKHFELSCEVVGKAPHLEVRFETESFIVNIDETEATAVLFEKKSKTQRVIDYRSVLQSAMTQKVVASLTQSGECDLTPYHESAALHRPFLKALTYYFTQFGGVENSRCPIT